MDRACSTTDEREAYTTSVGVPQGDWPLGWSAWMKLRPSRRRALWGIAMWDLGTPSVGLLYCVGFYKRPVISD